MKQARRVPRQAVDGVLLLDKPRGISSQAAVSRVKRAYNAQKAGHTGTLDPMADGLLPICLGEATKFSQFLLESDKSYLATVRLGVTTTTGDLEGEVIRTAEPPTDWSLIATAVAALQGSHKQLPPMYSALKHQGRPLYSYARAGEDVARDPRDVTIHEIALLGLDGAEARVTVRCSKGTYVRVLATDLGDALGCGACLSGLRRTGTGGLQIDDSVTLAELEAMPPSERFARLQPPDLLARDLPELELTSAQCADLRCGRTFQSNEGLSAGAKRLYGPGRFFLGVGEVEDGRVRARRLVATSGDIASDTPPG